MQNLDQEKIDSGKMIRESRKKLNEITPKLISSKTDFVKRKGKELGKSTANTGKSILTGANPISLAKNALKTGYRAYKTVEAMLTSKSDILQHQYEKYVTDGMQIILFANNHVKYVKQFEDWRQVVWQKPMDKLSIKGIGFKTGTTLEHEVKNYSSASVKFMNKAKTVYDDSDNEHVSLTMNQDILSFLNEVESDEV